MGCCIARLAAHFVEQPAGTTENSEQGGSLFVEGESRRGAAWGADHGGNGAPAGFHGSVGRREQQGALACWEEENREGRFPGRTRKSRGAMGVGAVHPWRPALGKKTGCSSSGQGRSLQPSAWRKGARTGELLGDGSGCSLLLGKKGAPLAAVQNQGGRRGRGGESLQSCGRARDGCSLRQAPLEETAGASALREEGAGSLELLLGAGHGEASARRPRQGKWSSRPREEKGRGHHGWPRGGAGLGAMERSTAPCCCCRGRKKTGRLWRLEIFEGWECKNASTCKERAPIYRRALGLGFLSGPNGLGWDGMGLAQNTYSGRAKLFFRIKMLPRNSFVGKTT
jgi:hypothetical protein